MALRDKVVAEGMRLLANPTVANMMLDPRLMRLVVAAMSVPDRVSSFPSNQREAFAMAMNLAHEDEVRDLRRTVAALERAVARLEAGPRAPPSSSHRVVISRRRAGLGDCIVSLLTAWRYARVTGRALVADWRFSAYGPTPQSNVFGLVFEPPPMLSGCRSSATIR